MELCFKKNVSLPCEKDLRTVSIFAFTRSKSPPSTLDHDLLVGFQSSRLSSLTLDLAYFLKINISKNLTFILSFPYPLGTLASFHFWPGLVFLTPLHWFPSLPAAPPFTSPGTQPSWPGAQESINTSSMAMGTVFRQTNCSLCLLGTWGQQLKHSHNSIPKTGDCYLDAQGNPSQDIII